MVRPVAVLLLAFFGLAALAGAADNLEANSAAPRRLRGPGFIGSSWTAT